MAFVRSHSMTNLLIDFFQCEIFSAQVDVDDIINPFLSVKKIVIKNTGKLNYGKWQTQPQ